MASEPGLCEGTMAHKKETTIPTFTINTETYYIMKGHINRIPMNVLAKTGAAAMIISKELWDTKKNPNGAQLESSAGRKLVGVQSIPLNSMDLHRYN